jgi:solute:Na+ symporter, SSS family
VGWRSRAHESDEREMLVGGRQIPWWAVLMSILGTEISALTFVGVPAFAFSNNWTYLQVTVAAITGRYLVARFFVPAFYRHNVVSIYELMLLRFGPATRNVAVLLFLFTRVLMSGVRLYAGALVLQVAFGISAVNAVVLLACVGFVFCALGGIKAVVWTEVLQVSCMFLGALCTLGVLWFALPNGAWATLPAGSMQVLDLRWDPSMEFALWSIVLGTTLTNAAIFGTDYDMVQRMLTARDTGESRKAVLGSAFAEIPITAMFLLIGTLLRLYYQSFPDPALPSAAKEVFGHFIVTQLPVGLCGLLIAAVISVVLSTYESALTALAGSFVVDLYRPYLRPGASPAHYVAATRVATLGFALLLTLVAIRSQSITEILKFGLEVGTYTYGALLGLFTMALWRSPQRRAGPDGWTAALAVPLSVVAVLSLHHFTNVAFPFYVGCGALTSIVVIALGNLLVPERRAATLQPAPGLTPADGPGDGDSD